MVILMAMIILMVMVILMVMGNIIDDDNINGGDGDELDSINSNQKIILPNVIV